jgi:hypothetical protein
MFLFFHIKLIYVLSGKKFPILNKLSNANREKVKVSVRVLFHFINEGQNESEEKITRALTLVIFKYPEQAKVATGFEIDLS